MPAAHFMHHHVLIRLCVIRCVDPPPNREEQHELCDHHRGQEQQEDPEQEAIAPSSTHAAKQCEDRRRQRGVERISCCIL